MLLDTVGDVGEAVGSVRNTHTVSQHVVKYSSIHRLFAGFIRTVFIMWWDAVAHAIHKLFHNTW